jgi:hypothetical protein
MPAPDGCSGAGGGGVPGPRVAAPAGSWPRSPAGPSSRPGPRPSAGAATRRPGALSSAGGGAQPPSVRPSPPRSSAQGVQGGAPLGTVPAPRPARVCARAAPSPHARAQGRRSGRRGALVPPRARPSGSGAGVGDLSWGAPGDRVARLALASLVGPGVVSCVQETSMRQHFRGCT